MDKYLEIDGLVFEAEANTHTTSNSESLPSTREASFANYLGKCMLRGAMLAEKVSFIAVNSGLTSRSGEALAFSSICMWGSVHLREHGQQWVEKTQSWGWQQPSECSHMQSAEPIDE